MEFMGVAGVAAIGVIAYLIGEAVKISPADNKYIPVICGTAGALLGVAAMYTVPEFPAGNDRAGRNFTPVSLDFLGRTCYNQRSFILFKTLMRTNRGPALHAAERAAPQGCCKQPAMCRTSTTAECRGEPLPGAPVTAQRVACSSTQFGWNRGTQLDFQRRFIP